LFPRGVAGIFKLIREQVRKRSPYRERKINGGRRGVFCESPTWGVNEPAGASFRWQGHRREIRHIFAVSIACKLMQLLSLDR